MDNYEITQSLEVINGGCEEGVVIEDYPSVQVIGWRVVTTTTTTTTTAEH